MQDVKTTQKEDIRIAISRIPSYNEIQSYIILAGYRGSQAHGTHVPTHPDSTDDVDIMSIIVPPIEDYYLGLKEFGTRGTREIKHNQYDIVIYELQKYIRLLIKNNPNVIMLLWLEEIYYFHRSKAGNFLIDKRETFNSKEAYYSFSGYAYSQLQRMTHFDKNAMDMEDALVEKIKQNPNDLMAVSQYEDFKKKYFSGYCGDKRKKLIRKYGYDTKNGSHLIRLLKMCYEFLTTQRLNVLRHDNKMLIDIKYGGWELKKVQEEADRLMKMCESALATCTLPTKVDFEEANKICVECIRLVQDERSVGR